MTRRTFVLKKPREAVRLRAKFLNVRGVPVRIVVRAQKSEPIADDDEHYSKIR